LRLARAGWLRRAWRRRWLLPARRPADLRPGRGAEARFKARPGRSLFLARSGPVGVVDRSYEDKKPFAFTGTVKKVVFDVKPHLAAQDEEDLHAAAHHGHAAHGLSQ
jgi:hypothetical protein